ncbi:hypothetical protein Tco_0144164 [Tanacetum coccineum]
MLREYNDCINQRADEMPITKISYRIDSSKEASMRITRGNNPLNVVVHPKFRLKSLGFSEWLEIHSLASKGKGKANDILLQSLKAKFDWIKSQEKALGIPPPPELSNPVESKKRKRAADILKEVFVKEDVVVDGMHRNLIHPPRVEGRRGLVISEPEAGIFCYNGNFNLVFQRVSEFHLATTVQLIRLQEGIIRGSPDAEAVFHQLDYEIEARSDVTKAREIVRDNLDGMGQFIGEDGVYDDEYDDIGYKSCSSATPKTIMNDDKFSSEQGVGGEDGVYHDESDDISYKSSSFEKVQPKVTYEDELLADEKCESEDSFGEPAGSVVDDLDSQHEVKNTRTKRLYKAVVEDDEEEDDKFHDVEMDFSAARNFTHRGKRPTKNLSTSSATVIQAKSNVHKPVKVSEHVDAGNTSFSFASKQPDSTLKATTTRKENVNSVYVKNEVRKHVPTASVVHPRKYETNEVDDDDDECMVTSGQKFVQKVESRLRKLQSDDFNKVFRLDDDTNVSATGAEVTFSLSNPKSNFALPSKIVGELDSQLGVISFFAWFFYCMSTLFSGFLVYAFVITEEEKQQKVKIQGRRGFTKP